MSVIRGSSTVIVIVAGELVDREMEACVVASRMLACSFVPRTRTSASRESGVYLLATVYLGGILSFLPTLSRVDAFGFLILFAFAISPHRLPRPRYFVASL